VKIVSDVRYVPVETGGSSPRSPRLIKGAIIGQDPFNPVASIITFQYNPETLTRTLQPQGSGEGGARSEAMRLRGAPVETIRMEVEIDITDQLEKGDTDARDYGIYPQLSALEMLVYPKLALVATNTINLALGTIEIVPPTGPNTLLIWGKNRVVPVRLTDYSVVEEAYDERLNPIRAKVTLSLRVLSYNDVSLTDPAYTQFITYQGRKEGFGSMGSVGNLQALREGQVQISES
jgi:hypothetical protein